MILHIQRQENYSRGQLLLRAFFGWIYILAPHLFILMFLGIWSSILTFLSFWIILFTGRYPESFFEFQIKLIRWNLRLNASLFDLTDEYPRFGLDSGMENLQFNVKYPENFNRINVIIKALFGGIYVGIPHGFILFFRLIAMSILNFLAFWAVLFTGKYPESWFDFTVGHLRWTTRVNLYLGYLTDTYPPFTGVETQEEYEERMSMTASDNSDDFAISEESSFNDSSDQTSAEDSNDESNESDDDNSDDNDDRDENDSDENQPPKF